MDDTKLAYLGFLSTGSNTYTGGIMVCDSRGFPLEFRYSEPITPTRVQQVLYGNVLDTYIKLDVISEKLIKSATSPFNIMVVQEDTLLEHEFSSSITTVKISAAKSPPLSEQGDTIKIKDKEFLIQTTKNTSPKRVQLASSQKLDEAKVKSIIETLAKVGLTMDLDEPISRVYRALELICQQATAQKQG